LRKKLGCNEEEERRDEGKIKGKKGRIKGGKKRKQHVPLLLPGLDSQVIRAQTKLWT
jgi:hypothetical protein